MEINTNFQKWTKQPSTSSGFQIPHKYAKKRKSKKNKSRGSK